MRIVFVNPSGSLGGGERSLLDLMHSLRAAAPDMEMHLICLADGPLLGAARETGAIVELVPMPRGLRETGESDEPVGRLKSLLRLARAAAHARRFAPALRDAILAARPDVVHSNGMKSHVLTSLAPPPRGAPLVWHVRDFVADRPLGRRLPKYAARRDATVLAVSRAVAEEFRHTNQRVEVVYNAIDTEHFAPAGPCAALDELARVAPAPAGVLRVGVVATYARWKGHDLLIEAARFVREREPRLPVRFYVIGGPIYQTRGSQVDEAELRAMGTSRGVADLVSLVPFQADPGPAYRALDVVVHASTRPEPFGRTIVEAMSCGRAVVVSNEGGAAELIRDGHDAIAFRPRDPDALAGAILQLATDQGLRARLGAAARASAVHRFSRARLGPQVLQIYHDLMTRS